MVKIRRSEEEETRKDAPTIVVKTRFCWPTRKAAVAYHQVDNGGGLDGNRRLIAKLGKSSLPSFSWVWKKAPREESVSAKMKKEKYKEPTSAKWLLIP